MAPLTKNDIKSRIDRIAIDIMIGKGIKEGVEDLMDLSVDISKEIHGESQADITGK